MTSQVSDQFLVPFLYVCVGGRLCVGLVGWFFCFVYFVLGPGKATQILKNE